MFLLIFGYSGYVYNYDSNFISENYVCRWMLKIRVFYLMLVKFILFIEFILSYLYNYN